MIQIDPDLIRNELCSEGMILGSDTRNHENYKTVCAGDQQESRILEFGAKFIDKIP